MPKPNVIKLDNEVNVGNKLNPRLTDTLTLQRVVILPEAGIIRGFVAEVGTAVEVPIDSSNQAAVDALVTLVANAVKAKAE